MEWEIYLYLFSGQNYLSGQLFVGPAAFGIRVVLQNGFTVRRRFRQSNRPGNDRTENMPGEILIQLVKNRFRQLVPAVVHG